MFPSFSYLLSIWEAFSKGRTLISTHALTALTDSLNVSQCHIHSRHTPTYGSIGVCTATLDGSPHVHSTLILNPHTARHCSPHQARLGHFLMHLSGWDSTTATNPIVTHRIFPWLGLWKDLSTWVFPFSFFPARLITFPVYLSISL